MIRITPFYERQNCGEIQRKYLRMVAAVTPFLPEDVLFDDPEGLARWKRIPKNRTRIDRGRVVDTAVAKMLHAKGVKDGSDTEGMLLAEAKLAEIVIREYSEDLHKFLYTGKGECTGYTNQENLRKLLLVRLPNGQVPECYRFNDVSRRSGTQSVWKRRAIALSEYVFCYDDFSKLRHTDWHCGIHDLVAMLDVKVCPYCNRLYTTTVSTGKHRVRPQLDHFRSKLRYPFLALSINNLVPSCGICNLLKRDKDCDIVYPYDEDFEAAGLVFRTSIPADHTVPALEGIQIAEDDFKVLMEQTRPDEPIGDGDRWNRVQESKKELCLEELYQSHRDYIAFLYRQRYVLTKQLAEDLHGQFKDLFSTAEEVEDVFALMYTDYGHWGDRPLAKLTHDVLAEIEDLYRHVDEG